MYYPVLSLLLLWQLCAARWLKEMENPELFEGDIVLNAEQKKALENHQYGAVKLRSKRFPRAYFLYEFGPQIIKKPVAIRNIKKAMAEINKYTCLRFYPRNQSDFPSMEHLFFYEGKGCSSKLGFQGDGKEHPISLAKNCWYFVTIIHEIMHTIGFYHEQSRPDRDKYISINTHAIPPMARENFRKMGYDTIDSRGSPYDYRSIMHYPRDAFSKNGANTIITKDSRYQYELGQRAHMTYHDQYQINKLYDCVKPVPTIEPPNGPRYPPGCYNRISGCDQFAYYDNLCGKRDVQIKCPRSCGLCKPYKQLIQN